MNKQFMHILVLIIIVFVSLSSCGKWNKDEELTLEKQPYNGNELRLDGYYYYMKDGKIFSTCIFYKNGVMINGGGADPNNTNPIAFLDTVFSASFFSDQIKKDKTRWGVFQIQDNSIVFENWLISEGSRPIGRFSGNILNDTTFVITMQENPYSGNVYPINNLYHFRAFSPKPDSTNVFIP